MELRRRLFMQQEGGGGGGDGYIQDGLILRLDAFYDCTASLWVDMIGGVQFTGNGNVQIQNGVPYFDGTAWYTQGTSDIYNGTTHTIEAVFVYEGNTNTWGSVFSGAANYCIGCVMTSAENALGMGYAQVSNVGLECPTKNTLHRVGMNIDNRVLDATKITPSRRVGYTYFSIPENRIGCRQNNNSCFIGSIYAIRIYNRSLSEQEIIANQAIDLARFGGGHKLLIINKLRDFSAERRAA